MIKMYNSSMKNALNGRATTKEVNKLIAKVKQERHSGSHNIAKKLYI